MKTGIIKMYNAQRGFGFIIEDETEDELFLNASDLHPTARNKKLREGQRVKFDIRSDMKGDKAVNVRPA
ncbi:MAG TPA: cold shock domain-containing protein [Caldithrix abyssi]|uniref:Cold shock domain-containing protein n=1 Tax=Caldithrix abyssi TaxID=187145 RepID=A0A7V1LKN9_CALAY|nr:cold shock domain-containing protein [Caldithrix abyssi]